MVSKDARAHALLALPVLGTGEKPTWQPQTVLYRVDTGEWQPREGGIITYLGVWRREYLPDILTKTRTPQPSLYLLLHSRKEEVKQGAQEAAHSVNVSRSYTKAAVP